MTDSSRLLPSFLVNTAGTDPLPHRSHTMKPNRVRIANGEYDVVVVEEQRHRPASSGVSVEWVLIMVLVLFAAAGVALLSAQQQHQRDNDTYDDDDDAADAHKDKFDDAGGHDEHDDAPFGDDPSLHPTLAWPGLKGRHVEFAVRVIARQRPDLTIQVIDWDDRDAAAATPTYRDTNPSRVRIQKSPWGMVLRVPHTG